MKVADIIPTGYLPPLAPALDGAEPRRVALIHKRHPTYSCVLSRSMETLSYDKPIEDAFAINLFDREHVTIFYKPKITFHPRMISKDAYYTFVEFKNLISNKIQREKIPFVKSGELVSDIIAFGEGLDGKVNALFSAANEQVVALCESIADNGFLRAGQSPRLKETRVRYKEIGCELYNQLAGLFHEEPDEKPLKKHDLRVADRRFGNYFTDPRRYSRKVKNHFLLWGALIPTLSVAPASLPDLLEKHLRKKYEKRFDTMLQEEEKEAIALSEFAVCNPKMMSGIRRGYFELKAIGDLGTYALQLAANVCVFSYLSPWISIPLVLPTALTSAVMLRNALRSGGQDFSGILSTAAETITRHHSDEIFK